MDNHIFNPQEYYTSYPKRVIRRPGYPARAQWKSTLMWSLFGNIILRELGEVKTYADVGGCFGFGANSMAFQICKSQGYYPNTTYFEISPEFIAIGKQLFPDITFIEGEIKNWNGYPEIFDLITLFDVVEHIPNPEIFLRNLSLQAKFILLITPMETSGEWFGSYPPAKQGKDHNDGHVNFFNPGSYTKLLEISGLHIVKSHLVPSSIPRRARLILDPEHYTNSKSMPKIHKQINLSNHRALVRKIKYKVSCTLYFLPFSLSRKLLGGGAHLCLVKPK